MKTKAKDPSYGDCQEITPERCKSTNKLLEHSLDELGEVESLVGLTVPDVLAKNSNGFCVGIGVELVTSLKKDKLEFLI